MMLTPQQIAKSLRRSKTSPYLGEIGLLRVVRDFCKTFRDIDPAFNTLEFTNLVLRDSADDRNNTIPRRQLDEERGN